MSLMTLLVVFATYSLFARTAVATASAPQVVVVLSVAPDPVIAGNNVTYTVTVTNTAAVPATNVSAGIFMPYFTTFISFNTPPGWTTFFGAFSPPTVGATICSLPAGASVSFTLVLKLDTNVPTGPLVASALAESVPGGVSTDMATTTV